MIKVVTALFKNHISLEEIPLFRGCMIRCSGYNNLFHNHDDKGFRYSYPLIQYKRIKGCAAFVGINEGGEAVECLVERGLFDCCLGSRELAMEIEAVRSEKRSLQVGMDMNTYELKRWIPLNRDNYEEYQKKDRLVERIEMLEKILVGNILSFAKGLGVYFDSLVLCQIAELEDVGVFHYKNVDLVCFSVIFRTNVTLPDYVGLGKSASISNGMVFRVK